MLGCISINTLSTDEGLQIMTKNTNSVKSQELLEVGLAYSELKGLWNKIMAVKKREAEEELQKAREEFSILIQSKVDRTGFPYKITVADLARAMQTTNRGTVYEYLKDAKERAANRFFQELNPVFPYELVKDGAETFGNPSRTLIWGVVHDGENYWNVEQMGTSSMDAWITEPDDSSADGYRKTGAPKTHRLPLTTDAPEWLNWLVRQDEWVEKVALLG